MRNLQYRIYCESIHFHAPAIPEDQFDIIDCRNELTEFSPTLIASHSTLFEAMKDLADRRCTARLAPVCDGTVCLADVYYLEETEVIDSKTGHCVMTGNRWFAAYNPKNID